MKVVLDLDDLVAQGIISPELSKTLAVSAARDTGSTAINMLLAFGAVVVVGGIVALVPDEKIGALFGLAFLLAGWFIRHRYVQQWAKLGDIWLIVGALLFAGSVAVIIQNPFPSSIAAALILAGVGYFAKSRLLFALVPFAIIGAIGGSTSYWSGCYSIIIQECTLTILLFTGLGLVGWNSVKRTRGDNNALALTFTRICVILVNFGFWVGSLWGDTPGALWRYKESDYYTNPALYDRLPEIPSPVFALAWAAALILAGIWAAKNGRRFLVNLVAVFGAIHFYTQWFERLQTTPLTVIAAGIVTIAIGLGLWKYNKRQLEPVGEIRPLT